MRQEMFQKIYKRKFQSMIMDMSLKIEFLEHERKLRKQLLLRKSTA